MKRTIKRKKLKHKRNKIVLLSLIPIILVSISVFICLNILEKKESQIPNKSVVSNSKTTTDITLSTVGDIMVHSPQLKSQFDNTNNSYSFDNNFKYISPYILKSDLAIANLETTLAGSDNTYSSFPRFNSPDELAVAIKNSGFDIVSTINNHSYDKGSDGVYRTLDILKSKGLKTVGTRKSESESNYLIENIDGVKLGITSYSYGQVSGNSKALNGLPVKSSDLNNLNIFTSTDVNKAFEEIKSTLDEMNKNKTDLQVVMLHWGNEYNRYPDEFQNELARMLCDYGVDIIIGSHPHVVQPIEMIQSDKNDNQTLVIYSLGNFLSNQRNEILNKKYTEDGVIVNININKNLETNETKVSDVEYIPTWVNKYLSKNGKYIYEIVPLINKEQILSIPNVDYDKAEQSYKNTTDIIKSSDIIKCKK